MSDYTPNTAGAQRYYVGGRAQARRWATGEKALDLTGFSHEFDRWLNRVKAKAWYEGAESAYYDPDYRDQVNYPENPYRKGVQE